MVLLLALILSSSFLVASGVLAFDNGSHQNIETQFNLDSNEEIIDTTTLDKTPQVLQKIKPLEEDSSHQPQQYTNPRTFPKNHPMNNYSDVLVIVNENSTISQQIGNYFKQQRNIPDINICVINTSNSEWIYNYTFHDMRAQIEAYLETNNLTRKINYIVTTKGVPLRIYFSSASRRSSVDSELCLILGSWAHYIDDPGNPKITNPFYNKEIEFSRNNERLYLVTRLTGFNFSQVKQLIDNAEASPGQRGNFRFDADTTKQGTNWARPGNTWMSYADDILDNRNYISNLDWTTNFITGNSNLAGYCSWGGFDSNYLSNYIQNPSLEADSSPADGVPDGWYFDILNSSDHISRNNTVNYTGDWSINITRDNFNSSSYTALSQNITIVSGRRYYVKGYVKLSSVASTGGGGAFLQIKAYNGANELVWITNGTRVYDSDPVNNWRWMYPVYYDPIPGVTKITVSAVLDKASGTAFFEYIRLYRIKPQHSYVPGAITEVYGYRTAYTFDYENTYSRFITELNVGELIRDGVTGIKGYVEYVEGQYINSVTRPNILFDRYTKGYNLAESFYMATRYLSWTDVVIGDPKTAPYHNILPDATLTADDISFSKGNPNQGESVKVFSRIENGGGSDLLNMNVSFKVGDDFDNANVVGTKFVSYIPTTGSVLINISWDTSAYSGLQNVWVFADSSYHIREQNESNNIGSKQILINSFPFGIEINTSDSTVYRGNSVTISINITDNETLEQNLNCTIFKKQTSDLDWIRLQNIAYNIDHWEIQFTTVPNSTLGLYDIKATIADENNATTDFIENSVIEVLNNPPELSNFIIQDALINRTQDQNITFTAYDFEDEVTTDMLTVLLRDSDGVWFIPELQINYNQATDQWEAVIMTNKTNKIGQHDLIIELVDNDGEGTTIELLNAFEVVNNAPIINEITLSKTSIYRTGFTTISIYGRDIEDTPEDISVELEYKLAVETEPWITWAEPKPRLSYWEALFTTNRSISTGNYIFRAKITDSDNDSTPFLKSDIELEVLNNPPVPKHNFIELTEIFEANEDQIIFFDASNSTDEEDFVCSGFLWDFNDGITSENVNDFHVYSKSGDYNISLTVYDKDLAVGQTNFTIRIKNVPPVADFIIQATHSIVEAGEPILFDGTSSFDTKSDKANLTYFWDFNDGTNSSLPIVNYTFKNSGTYLVTLTVTDNDDITHSKQTAITIIPSDVEIDDKPKTEGEGDSSFVLIIIFLIIIIIILLVAFWTVKKRRAQRRMGEGEEPLATVEATVLDAPEISAGKALAVGRTRKPTEKMIKPSKTIKTIPGPKSSIDRGLPPTEEVTSALPPAAPEESISPETEIEFVPEVSLPEPEEAGPSEEIIEPVPEEIATPIPEVDLDIEVDLPPDSDEVPAITTPETIMPEVTESEVELPESEELDFVPPKIDLTGIVPPPVQQTQPHRQEIVEAHRRGEGISFDFKKPGKKKQK